MIRVCYSLILLNLFKYAGVGVEKYMLAEGFGLSGIISILFTGIVSLFIWDLILRWNVKAGHTLDSYFSQLYPSLCLGAKLHYALYFINGCTFVMYKDRSLRYGLRGAMAFALALQSVHDLPDGHGQTILTATISIVVLSVLLIGGSTSTMLEALHVVGDSGDNHRPLEEQHNFDGNDSGDLGLNDEEGSTTASRFKLKLRDIQRSFD
ncbi:hypothetical protein PR202_ga21390 [Eleusine coracana subsp. coracana]|uniref:Uncharacterized protein n=1 Tax=Eleusine coracana subsp. coracana TaxID=191504 RepID=A0AAV5D1G8_ELECO|nr:hypothetical protein PR202_ga21390 [Eleusine coracana subsp. coracana]